MIHPFFERFGLANPDSINLVANLGNPSVTIRYSDGSTDKIRPISHTVVRNWYGGTDHLIRVGCKNNLDLIFCLVWGDNPPAWNTEYTFDTEEDYHRVRSAMRWARKFEPVAHATAPQRAKHNTLGTPEPTQLTLVGDARPLKLKLKPLDTVDNVGA
jgi:hypothetical protein